MAILRILLALLLLTFISIPNKLAAQQPDNTQHFRWEILPDKHIVPLFTADSRAHRISLQKPFNDNGYIFSMGGIFPLVNLAYKKHSIQLSGASSIYSTLEDGPAEDL